MLHLFHKGSHTGRDSTEIVVLQLLVLGTFMSHQRPFGETQVGTGGIECLVYQEIFLFPTKVGVYLLHFGMEEVAYCRGCPVYRREGFQQWCLVVECLPGVGDEDRRDTEGVIDDESG